MRPLIVTGCGRSGTGYAAALLTAAGAPCGHEQVFTGRPEAWPVLATGKADSSWFAVPHLSRQRDAYVVHQVRHPLDVVASWLANGSLQSRFVRRYLGLWCPEALREPTPEHGVLRYWVNWNRQAAKHADQRWHVDGIGPEHLDRALRLSGRPTGQDTITDALEHASHQTNHRADVHPIGWADLGKGRLIDDAHDLARQMGHWS